MLVCVGFPCILLATSWSEQKLHRKAICLRRSSLALGSSYI